MTRGTPLDERPLVIDRPAACTALMVSPSSSLSSYRYMGDTILAGTGGGAQEGGMTHAQLAENYWRQFVWSRITPDAGG